MSIENEFRSEVRPHLERLTNDLVPILTQLVNYDFPREVVAIAFEVFYDGFTSGFPVRAFFVDEDNSEFFVFDGDEANYPSPVDPGLLDIEQVYPEALDEKYSRDDEFDIYTLASMELIDWFSGCWSKAGGKLFSRAAIISIHDDTQVFDLKTEVWFGD
jgi:hypothetical protein